MSHATLLAVMRLHPARLLLPTVVLLALLGPNAAPQTPPLATYTLAVDVQAAPDPILPFVQTAAVTGTVSLTCEPNSLRTTSAPLRVTITGSSDQPNAGIAWHPARADVDFTRQQCLDGHTVTVPVAINLTLGAGFAAGDEVTFQFAATVDAENLQAETSWTQEAALRFDHRGRFDQERWNAPRGESVAVTGVFEHNGNSDVTLRFALDKKSSEALEVVLPTDVAVAPGTTQPFTIQVEVTPASRAAQEDSLAVVLEAAVGDQPAVIGPRVVIVTTLDTAARAAKDSPGIGPEGLLLLLAALAAARYVPTRSRKL